MSFGREIHAPYGTPAKMVGGSVTCPNHPNVFFDSPRFIEHFQDHLECLHCYERERDTVLALAMHAPVEMTPEQAMQRAIALKQHEQTVKSMAKVGR